MVSVLEMFLALLDVELVPKKQLASEPKKKSKKQSTKLGSSSDSLGSVSSFRFQTDGNGFYYFIASGGMRIGSGSFCVYKDIVYTSYVSGGTTYTLTDTSVKCKYGTYPITPNKYYKVKSDGSVGLA
jgi:hypothetical protein